MSASSTLPSGGAASRAASPERIQQLSTAVLGQIRASITEISAINLQTRILSMNAQIEASRAGESGRSFSVVGQEMVTLSHRTESAARRLEGETEHSLKELADISHKLATQVQAQRLCDLALTNIDLIDRNLYERSCDCRWWATDTAMVEALQTPDEATAKHASARMGVILKAYTVYFDIVLARSDGTIIANGRPGDYPSVGQDCHNEPWFRSAWSTRSGDEFGFQSVHPSSLANQQRVLVYSCKVCRGGDAQAEPIGVLGVVFNWDGLAQKVVRDTPIQGEHRERTRVLIADDQGLVLADSAERMLVEKIEFPERAHVFQQKKVGLVTNIHSTQCIVAHALSPGFETYRTGWHSLIIEQLRP